MAKRALITGITGQDGSYLAEHLLGLGYDVHGIVRRVAMEDPGRRLARLDHVRDRVTWHAATLESYPSLFHIVSAHRFDEVYHLAAQSFVAESFADGFSTMNANINGTHHMLAALREASPQARFYFAGSSEMFGKAREVPQRESTPFHPRSPYGISKVTGFHLAQNYREAYGMYCASGILFNHESPRRGFEFVTRKVTSAVGRIKAGRQDRLTLGSLDARRDWGHAADYVVAMHLMLQADVPSEYVVATGVTHTVRDVCQLAFAAAGLDWERHVVVDDRFRRPAEVEVLVGDAGKARRELGWTPTRTFEQTIGEMVRADVDAAAAGTLR